MKKIYHQRLVPKIRAMKTNNKNWKLLLILGISSSFILAITVQSGVFISNIFLILFFGVFYLVTKLLGFTPEQTERLFMFFELQRSGAPVSTTLKENTIPLAEDLYYAFFNLVLWIPRVAYRSISITFPMIMDIKLETDWIYVSFPYILRTFFNLAQFILLFIFMKKMKRRIRKKINDKYMKKETDWSAIKCF